MPIDPSPQLNLPFGKKLADVGMRLAIDHANEKITRWIEYAWEHFKIYLKRMQPGDTFMIEDFREYLKTHLIEPPSKRAFGGIAVRGTKHGLIAKAGHAHVKNSNAHACFATVWKKL